MHNVQEEKEKKARVRRKVEGQVRDQVRRQHPGPKRKELIAEPVPLCVGEPYRDPGRAAVMSRHRGRQLGTVGRKSGKSLPDAYLHMEVGASFYVETKQGQKGQKRESGDPYITPHEAERAERKRNNSLKLENRTDRRTGSAAAPRAFCGASANDRGSSHGAARGTVGEVYLNSWSQVTSSTHDQAAVRRTLRQNQEAWAREAVARSRALREKSDNLVVSVHEKIGFSVQICTVIMLRTLPD
jgi:hypothetical protein